MGGFHPGDLVLCRFGDEDVWYFAEVLSQNQGTDEWLLTMHTDTGYKVVSKEVAAMLHIGGEYYPSTDMYKKVRVIMEDGTGIPLDEFCSSHTIRRAYLED